MPNEEHRLHFKLMQKMGNTTEKVSSHTYLYEPVQEISSSKIQLKIVETPDKKMKDDLGVSLTEIGDIIEVKFGKKNVQDKLDVAEGDKEEDDQKSESGPGKEETE